MNSSGKAQIYRDASASVEVRTADLLGRMTLDEKVAQLHAFWLILSPNGEHKVRSDSFTGVADQATLKKMLSHGLGQITRAFGTAPVSVAEMIRRSIFSMRSVKLMLFLTSAEVRSLDTKNDLE